MVIFRRCGSENGDFQSRSFRKLEFSVEAVPKMVIFCRGGVVKMAVSHQGGSENSIFFSIEVIPKMIISVEMVPKMVIFCRGGPENGNIPSRRFRKW